MPKPQPIVSQLKALLPTLLWAYVPTLIMIGIVVWYALITGRRVWYFTNDPFILGNLPFYVGVLSSLANILWGAAAAVCFFSALVLRAKDDGKRAENGKQRSEIGGRRTEDGETKFPYSLREEEGIGKMEEGSNNDNLYPLARFLLASGLLTSLLLFDDLFQFHRIFYIKYFQVSAKMVFAGYGVLAMGYLLHFRKTIVATEYLLLALALAFLGVAVVVDTTPLLPRGRTAFSDFLKFFGIVTWVAYFVRTGRVALRG